MQHPIHLSATRPFVLLMKGFMASQWTVKNVPQSEKLARNGQIFVLKRKNQISRYRIYIYSVAESGRNNPNERRIQITSTYQKNISPKNGYQDIVLGFEREQEAFVGIDPRRLEHGGKTGNASSFFDKGGLSWSIDDKILVKPYISNIFEIEYHAFFQAPCIAEYLLCQEEIHGGDYTSRKVILDFSKELRDSDAIFSESFTSSEAVLLEGKRVPNSVKEAFNEDYASSAEDILVPRNVESAGRKNFSPEAFSELQKQKIINGLLGEEFVINCERNFLINSNKEILAEKIEWTSQKTVNSGYDIFSFDENGVEKYIEVKSTSLEMEREYFEISLNEWHVAELLQDQYFIYLVVNVKKSPVISRVIQNPLKMFEVGSISKSPSGWRISLCPKESERSLTA